MFETRQNLKDILIALIWRLFFVSQVMLKILLGHKYVYMKVENIVK